MAEATPARRSPRLSMWAALGLVALAGAELASAAFFHAFAGRFPFREPQRFTLSAGQIAGLRGHFDPELGWRQAYPTEFGERPRPRSHGPVGLAVFGDSFVHGDEVGDAETWAEGLASRAGRDVLNFGTGGYGPDQALLLYRRLASRLPAPVVGLGFTGENVNRVVNRYRPFYFRETGLPYPKPRFAVRGGRLELIPQPLRSVDELARLGDPRTIEELGRGDAHYGTRFPSFGFPFLRLALHPAVWRHALAGTPRGELSGARQNHWRGEGREVFLAVLDAFVAEAMDHGRTAVLLLLPGADDVRLVREGRGAPGRRAVLEHCAAGGHACFDGVGALASLETADAAALFAPGGHPSAEGNRRLAAALHVFLAARPELSRDLTPPPVRR